MKIIKLAFQNFFRNFWLSLTSIIIILLMLFTLSLLYSVSILGNQALDNIAAKMDLGIYFKDNIDQNELNALKIELENCKETKEIHYLSPEESLSQFKERHKEDSIILNSLEELNGNPLGAVISIKFQNPAEYQETMRIINQERYQDLIHDQNFYDYEELIEIFNKFNQKIYHIGLIISGLFLLIAILVIFTAIKLGAISRKKEIRIMRLVGASSWFIRAPFLIEGALYAIMAWILNIAIIWLLSIFIQPQIKNFLQMDFSLSFYLQHQSLDFWTALLIFAVIISMMASALAVNKYTKT
ncbi:hypothetical protein B6D52_01115 [Candidatus Parcubacteria bacterium 4484_255]|nr:MAG: hypothetical protein B6D52_01115 [Candidatus Parcubacteria bacterium 4484_255]